jgi:Na+/alanine symporter
MVGTGIFLTWKLGFVQFVKFGHAMKLENSSEFNYYCPDKKVWEETGYFRDTSK